MKKHVCLLLSFVLLFSLCACGKSSSAEAASPASAPAQTAAPASVPAQTSAPAANFDPDIVFTSKDLDGASYDENVFAQHELTIIHCWNAWIGESVDEIPALERLYEKYKDQGLLVLGVYTMNTSSEQVSQVLDSTGASYPMLSFPQGLIEYQSGTFPNTVLVDREGHVVKHEADKDTLAFLVKNYDRGYAEFLSERVYNAPMSYETWEALVSPYFD